MIDPQARSEPFDPGVRGYPRPGSLPFSALLTLASHSCLSHHHFPFHNFTSHFFAFLSPPVLSPFILASAIYSCLTLTKLLIFLYAPSGLALNLVLASLGTFFETVFSPVHDGIIMKTGYGCVLGTTVVVLFLFVFFFFFWFLCSFCFLPPEPRSKNTSPSAGGGAVLSGRNIHTSR